MDLIIGVNNMTPIIRSIFILFGGSEYQNQPGYFHCSGERMKQQHQQSLYCNSSVEIQITKIFTL